MSLGFGRWPDDCWLGLPTVTDLCYIYEIPILLYVERGHYQPHKIMSGFQSSQECLHYFVLLSYVVSVHKILVVDRLARI